MKSTIISAAAAALIMATASAYADPVYGTVTPLDVWSGEKCLKIRVGGAAGPILAVPEGPGGNSLRANLTMIYNDGLIHKFMTDGEANACTNAATAFNLIGIDHD